MAAEQITTSAPEVLLHGGWVTSALLGALAWIARITIGRNLKVFDDKLDELREESRKRGEMLADVHARLARIEGRFEQQDHSK